MNTEAVFIKMQSVKKMLKPQDGCGYVELNLLTKRKSDQAKCELCDDVGQLVCESCRVTYYCTLEHFMQDKNFHASLCKRIAVLRRPIEFHPLSETRARWKKQRHIQMEELYLDTLTKGQADIEKGDYNSAIPSATVSAKYAEIVYGRTEEMIPPLMILAEAHLQKKNIRLAEGFLAKAFGVEVSDNRIRPSLKARVRHIEALIALARRDLENATCSFAEAIYQNTKEFGPIHIKTSENYCNLGHVFHLSRRYDVGCSLFRQTVHIWIAFLEPIFEDMRNQTQIPRLVNVNTKEKVWIEDCDKFLALSVLTRCYTLQMECYRQKPQKLVTDLDLAQTCYALGILHFIIDHLTLAHSSFNEAMVRLEQSHLQDLSLYRKLISAHKINDRKSYQQNKRSSMNSDDLHEKGGTSTDK